MATTLSDRSLAQRILHVLKRLVVHPLGHFALFIFFLYQVKEFYPFTHIPMYSDPESAAPYLYLADGDGATLDEIGAAQAMETHLISYSRITRDVEHP